MLVFAKDGIEAVTFIFLIVIGAVSRSLADGAVNLDECWIDHG
jgi:hypothetical protein